MVLCQPYNELVTFVPRLLGKVPAPWNPTKGCDDGWIDLWLTLICCESSGREHECVSCLEVYFSHADLVQLFP